MAPSITTAQVEEIVGVAIENALGQAMPEITGAVRDQLIEVMNERLAQFAANLPAGGQRGFLNRDFTDDKPPTFVVLI